MAPRNRQPENTAALRSRLLAWYAQHRRDLPWRRTRDPYAIWVSEIMLQQTRVAAVVERYGAFLARFPTVTALAQADEQEVLAMWSGLGYYRRARMLHQAAQLVAARNHGRLPESAHELRSLPGIGDYTAAAIASIAHGACAAVVDGNVERVLCRLQGWHEAGGRAAGALRRNIQALAAQWIDPTHPGDWNQAMMELGATICLPRNPRCPACPISGGCKTRGEHKTLPRPPMVRREIAYALVLRNVKPKAGRGPQVRQVLLEQRPAEVSVMPGLWELPALRRSAVPAQKLSMTLRHSIMQVNYMVRIRAVTLAEIGKLAVKAGKRRWVRLEDAGAMALTGLARKVLRHAHLAGAKSPANQ